MSMISDPSGSESLAKLSLQNSLKIPQEGTSSSSATPFITFGPPITDQEILKKIKESTMNTSLLALQGSSSLRSKSDAEISLMSRELYKPVLELELVALQKAQSLLQREQTTPSAGKTPTPTKDQKSLAIDQGEYQKAVKDSKDIKGRIEQSLTMCPENVDETEKILKSGEKDSSNAVKKFEKASKKLIKSYMGVKGDQSEFLNFLRGVIKNTIDLNIAGISLKDAKFNLDSKKASSESNLIKKSEKLKALEQKRQQGRSKVISSIQEKSQELLKILSGAAEKHYHSLSLSAVVEAIEICRREIAELEEKIQEKKAVVLNYGRKADLTNELMVALPELSASIERGENIYLVEFSMASLGESEGELAQLLNNLERATTHPQYSDTEKRAALHLSAKIKARAGEASKELNGIESEIEMIKDRGEATDQQEARKLAILNSVKKVEITENERLLLVTIGSTPPSETPPKGATKV